MKYVISILITAGLLFGCKHHPVNHGLVSVGFSTCGFKNGEVVRNGGGGSTYRWDQAEYNPDFDCDSFTIHYFDPINQVFTFVKQPDSTWKLIQ